MIQPLGEWRVGRAGDGEMPFVKIFFEGRGGDGRCRVVEEVGCFFHCHEKH